MKKFLALAILIAPILCPNGASAQFLRQPPDKLFQELWALRAENILIKLFPGDPLVAKINVEISPEGDPNASAGNDISEIGKKEISITYGLLVLADEDELEAALAHEFAHLKLKHLPTARKFPAFEHHKEEGLFGKYSTTDDGTIWNDDNPAYPREKPIKWEFFQDFELLEKEEIAADHFAATTLLKKTGSCEALYDLLQKLNAFKDRGADTDNPYDKIHIKRAAILKEECSRPKPF